ncbi:MAG TPA: type I secretion system permease/ATPase [Gammaproteobacteria bacterium]|nr:type I secretion system permease/ATPase [Gammaproteobacteria bacterium]
MSNHHELSQLLGRFRGAFISVGVFSFFFNLLVLVLPLYMLSVFTRVLTSKSEETLILLTIAAVIGLFIQALLDIIRSRVMVRVGMGLDAAMTPQVLEAVVRNAAGTGSRDTQPLRDAGEVRGFLSGQSIFALFDAPFAPIYVLAIYILHPLLGTLSLIGASVLFLIAVINEIGSRKPLKAIAAHSYKNQARVEEFVRNADAIEAMGMMPTVLNRWRTQTGEGVSALSEAADKATAASSLAKFIRFTLQIGLFGVGSYLYIEGEILAGSIIAASILMGRALAPVESAIGTWKNLVGAKAAYGRLQTLFSSERFAQYRDRMTLPKPTGRVELERVVVMAPKSERLILKGVSLSLSSGQFLGVIGPSGAGKTTLAKVLVGITSPRGGAGARLDGAELAAWHPDDLGRHIGYLPQDIQLFPGTVRENIARMATDSNPDDVVAAAKNAGVHEMILGLPEGYDSDIGEAGRFLSAGQRQHIGLARAFYGDPVLLVLDEPNSNLDAVSEDALSRALDAAKKRGTTIVVVTHRPSVLQASDQLLVLKDGIVELYGPSADVMARMRQGALPQESPHQQIPGARQADAPKRMRQPAGPQDRKPNDPDVARAAQGGNGGSRRNNNTSEPDKPSSRPAGSPGKEQSISAPRQNGNDDRPIAREKVTVPKRQILEPKPRPTRDKEKAMASNVKPKPAPVTIESSIVRAERLASKGEGK